MYRIIGIAGKAKAGKDTLANYLCWNTNKDYVKVHFADILKTGAMQICQLDRWSVDTQEGKESTIHWLNMTVRELLQKFGTAIRKEVDPDFWVKALLNKHTNDDIIIADVRFPNEAKAIKDAGGLLVRINRDSAGAGNHISEIALDNYTNWDFVINNNGTIEDLYRKGDEILNLINTYE